MVWVSWQLLVPAVSHQLKLRCTRDGGEQCSLCGGKRDLGLVCEVVHTWVFSGKSPGSLPSLGCQMAGRSHHDPWQELLLAVTLHLSHGMAFALSSTRDACSACPEASAEEQFYFAFVISVLCICEALVGCPFSSVLRGCCSLHPLTCSFPFFLLPSLAASFSCPSHRRRYS